MLYAVALKVNQEDDEVNSICSAPLAFGLAIGEASCIDYKPSIKHKELHGKRTQGNTVGVMCAFVGEVGRTNRNQVNSCIHVISCIGS